jgi:hypothetical protein
MKDEPRRSVFFILHPSSFILHPSSFILQEAMPTCIPQCVLVRSSWVYLVILTADCRLAVQFRNGFCCVYPLNQDWFYAMLGAPSKGKFHRRYIYKRYPYVRIRPPCPPPTGGRAVNTRCCANTPATLHATISGEAGSAVLTWDSMHSRWAGAKAMSCGATLSMRLYCRGTGVSGMTMTTSWDGVTFDDSSCLRNEAGDTCSPVNLNFINCNPLPQPQPAGCPAGVTIQVTA